MPRGVASIDPQNSPLSSSLLFPAVRVSGLLAAAAALQPHHRRRVLPRRFLPVPPSSPCPSRYPAGAPAILPGLLPFLPSRSHFLARLSHIPAPTPLLDFSLPAMRTPPSSPRHHHPRRRARMLLRRSIEADALSSNHAESDGSDELLRIPGLDPSAILRMKIKAMPLWKRGRSYSRMGLQSFFPEDRVKFSRRPDFNLAFIEIKYIGKYIR